MTTQPKLPDAAGVARDLRSWDVIRNHRTGSAGDHVTASWLAQEIVSAGAVPELDAFAFDRRVPEAARVTDGVHEARGVPCFDGPLNAGAVIRGAAGPADSDAPIRVVPFTPHANPVLDRLRREDRCEAVVAFTDAPNLVPGLTLLNAERFRDPYGPPVLQVGSEAGEWLRAAAGRGAVLNLQAGLSSEPANASNVQTTLPGTDPSLPPVVVMTPRSGWWTCTSERGGGICAWLACIRHFAQTPSRRTLVFTANTGHELGHTGLDHFAEERPSLYGSAYAWVHLGANFAAKGGGLLWQASSPEWLAQGRAALSGISSGALNVTPPGTRPLGEARNVFDAGGAYVSLLGSNPWFHNPDDRWPETIDLARTTALVGFVLEMVSELANG